MESGVDNDPRFFRRLCQAFNDEIGENTYKYTCLSYGPFMFLCLKMVYVGTKRPEPTT